MGIPGWGICRWGLIVGGLPRRVGILESRDFGFTWGQYPTAPATIVSPSRHSLPGGWKVLIQDVSRERTQLLNRAAMHPDRLRQPGLCGCSLHGQ